MTDQSDRIADLKRHAQLVLKAAEEVESWEPDYRAAILEVLQVGSRPSIDKPTYDTKPCPICQVPLSAERKPTLHLTYKHENLSKAERNTILSDW